MGGARFQPELTRGRTAARLLCLCVLFSLIALEGASQILPGSAPLGDGARVVLASGRVSVSRSGELWVLNPDDVVKPSQEIITGIDGYAVFELSDGSRFEVYPNSHVLFRSNRGNWADVLDVWVGRLKVHIEKIMGKPNPHRIHTPTAVISVRGTIFLVEVEEDSESTRVAVEEGEVLVDHRLLPTGKQRILGAGDELLVAKDEPIARAKVDKGGVLRASFRVLSDTLYAIAVRTRQPGSGAGPLPPGGGSPLPGDQGPPAPPPASGGGSTVPTTGGAPAPPPPPPGN